MKLSVLKIKNFRSYTQETVIHLSDLTVLIGKNDIGKSTILEALDIFFNGKPDKSDLAVNSKRSRKSNTIEITCIFTDIAETLVLDDSVEINVRDEYILNKRKLLEIKKVFTVSANGTINEETFLICNYPDHEELAKLLNYKNQKLKLKLEQLKVNNYSNKNSNDESIDKRKNSELRQAIRNYYYPDGSVSTKRTAIKIDGKLDGEDNRRKIWASLKKYLPIYSLFFVDKPLNDQDSDIQDPMKEIVKEVLKRDDIAPLLETLKQTIQHASTELAEDTIRQLNNLDSDLAETLCSSFAKEPNWNSIFKLTLEDKRGVPLNKRGSGMRRLVLLSFFRAQIESRRTQNSPDIIYALEEPETSQHPSFQLMIVNALKELASTTNAQVLFTTHNSHLAKEVPKNSLRYIESVNGNRRVESGIYRNGNDNVEVIDKIIDTLGSLPDPKNKVKVLICVEGENDVNGLIRLSKILHEHDSSLINLENNESVAFIPLGGSQLKHYVEKKYLDGLLQAQVHIFDSDLAQYVDLVNVINREKNPLKVGFNTNKLMFENYLHHEAINECFAHANINIRKINDKINVTKKVELAVKRKGHVLSAKTIKKKLNTKAVDNMTIERLKQRDGYDEVKLWLTTISNFAK